MDFAEFVKIAGPIFSGGVAGTIVGYFIKRYTDNRERRKASIVFRAVKYNLPENLFDSENLQVSYKNNQYESLILYEIELKNISQKIIEELIFIFEMNKNSRIIEKKVTKGLEQIEYNFNQDNIESHMLRFVAKNLYCGDLVKISILVEGEVYFKPHFRGNPDIEIVDENKIISSDKDLERIIGIFAAYILFGALPTELSGPFRAAAIFYNANIFINIFKKYFGDNKNSQNLHIEINKSSNTDIKIQ